MIDESTITCQVEETCWTNRIHRAARSPRALIGARDIRGHSSSHVEVIGINYATDKKIGVECGNQVVCARVDSKIAKKRIDTINETVCQQISRGMNC